MVAWPSYARVEAGGYGLSQDPDVARTPFDDGLVRQERRYTAAFTVREVTAHLVDDADLVRFRAWVGANAHTWFTWTDPEDGTSREVRVRGGAGGVAYTAHTAAGRRRWEARLELEGYAGRVVTSGS